MQLHSQKITINTHSRLALLAPPLAHPLTDGTRMQMHQMFKRSLSRQRRLPPRAPSSSFVAFALASPSRLSLSFLFPLRVGCVLFGAVLFSHKQAKQIVSFSKLQ